MLIIDNSDTLRHKALIQVGAISIVGLTLPTPSEPTLAPVKALRAKVVAAALLIVIAAPCTLSGKAQSME